MILLSRKRSSGREHRSLRAALIDLMAPQYVRLVERNDVNGVKTNYFPVFLKCKGSLSSKTKLAIVNKAVTEVQKYFHDSEQFEVQMETKDILNP